jgi:hypothetical protein
VRTLLVKPLGTPAENGSALLSALAGITGASATNPWLVKLEAGRYDVGAPALLAMKPYVDLEGAGEGVTKITSTGSSATNTGTLLCADASEVRFLTVENTGGGLSYATAISANGVSGSIRHVTARVSGATSQAIALFVANAASPTVTDVSVIADSGASGAAPFGFATVNSSPTVRHVESTVTGGFFGQAFIVQGGTADMADLNGVATGASMVSVGLSVIIGASATVRSSSFAAAGSPDAYGIQDGASLTLEDVRAVGTSTGGGTVGGAGIYAAVASLSAYGTYAQGSGTGPTFGLYTSRTNATLTGSTFVATGAPGTGVFNGSSMGGPYAVKIDGGTLQGGTGALVTNGTSTTNVFVGGSHFNGTSSVTGPSTHKCAGSWDAAYGFSASVCP